jgi:tRNA 2-thiouridine synthesizing protein A
MTTSIKQIKHEIDTSGTCCPIPMISTIKTLNRLEHGDIIKVLATDHGFLNDIRVLEESGKCVIIESGESDDFDYAILQKT